MIERWQVLEATEVGTSHIEAGENQGDDACKSKIMADGALCILTVADGAGSAELARVGAQTAVHAIVEAAQAKFSPIKTKLKANVKDDEGDGTTAQANAAHSLLENLPQEAAAWDSFISDIVWQARDQLQREAKKYENKPISTMSTMNKPKPESTPPESISSEPESMPPVTELSEMDDAGEAIKSSTDLASQATAANDDDIMVITDDIAIAADETIVDNAVTEAIATNDLTYSEISAKPQIDSKLSAEQKLTPDTSDQRHASSIADSTSLASETTTHNHRENKRPVSVPKPLLPAKQSERQQSIGNINKHYAASKKAADPLAKFATTTLGVIITPEWLVSWQIGDGVIVLRDAQGYRAITTPAKGEYANQTHFLTGEGFSKKMQIFTERRNPKQAINGVVLMTDGLERLAMQMQDNTPFAPFFDNLFTFAENSQASWQERQAGLQNTLRSEAVNQRTDDDKTIMVAFLESL